jgi:lysophospholipid acyltransferase (LPLAT)-like uncharacterized protein
MSKDFGRRVMAKAMTGYIDFVYRTSKVRLVGQHGLLRDPGGEKMVAIFWHGDSFCLYPSLRGLNIYIVVTRDRRGDYIEDVCRHFGYHALRIPDASEGGNHMFQIRKTIAGKTPVSIAITLDGPIGIYHVPKDFPFFMAMLTKRRVMPIQAEVRRCIRLTRRWDNFKIPLPFNDIKVTFHEPVTVERSRGEDPFGEIKNQIVSTMENTDLQR